MDGKGLFVDGYDPQTREIQNHYQHFEGGRPLLDDALFLKAWQLTENVYGAILEKVLPPNVSDRNPFHIRDLGTIFFIQAAAKYLRYK